MALTKAQIVDSVLNIKPVKARNLWSERSKAKPAANSIPENIPGMYYYGPEVEDNTVAVCRRENIAPELYYKWIKTFLPAGKRRLNEDKFVKQTAMKQPSMVGRMKIQNSW